MTEQSDEIELFHIIEQLLSQNPAWNASTTADKVVDAVVTAGWVRTPHEGDNVFGEQMFVGPDDTA